MTVILPVFLYLLFIAINVLFHHSFKPGNQLNTFFQDQQINKRLLFVSVLTFTVFLTLYLYVTAAFGSHPSPESIEEWGCDLLISLPVILSFVWAQQAINPGLLKMIKYAAKSMIKK
ncbi:MAG: hypothetical protein ABF868_05605 [Sporolactobacillus sp.]